MVSSSHGDTVDVSCSFFNLYRSRIQCLCLYINICAYEGEIGCFDSYKHPILVRVIHFGNY